MTENKKQTKKQKPKKVGTSRYSLIIIAVMVVLLAIPTYIVGNILYNAYIRQGEPIVGNRFEHDLDPAINSTQVNAIESELQGYEEVERATVNLQTSTFKVFLDVNESVLEENYESIANRAYETIVKTLPVDTYFTAKSGQHMYDLEISVFNQVERMDDESFIYFHLTKNSTMDNPIIQQVSVAKNQEVADRLRTEQSLRDLGESVEEPEPEVDVEDIEPVETP